jgi:cytochrome c
VRASRPSTDGINLAKGKAMIRMIVASTLLLFLTIPNLQSAEFGTREEAVAMVKRVQEMFNRDGPQATFKAITEKDSAFRDRDLYPFVFDLNGVFLAHGANAALIGKDLSALKDQDGKFLIREMIELVKGPGQGWVDYKWPNPNTNKIEDKSSYVEKMGSYVVGVGIYRH